MKFTSSTEKLLMKNSLFLYIAALLTSLFLFNFNIRILFALTLGYAVSLIRLRGLTEMVKIMFSDSGRSGLVIVKYFIIQLLTVILLFVSADKSLQVFFAVFIGVSIVTMTIMINAFTEAVGITNNNFE
ncbi:MAG: hypothetical protein ACM3KR_03705 [Deltaproteobacteria bacterium]